MKKLIIAHRGASAQAPENTLEAFEKAIEAKADMIELDVRRTRDKRLIVIHDPKVGKKKVGDLTYRQLLSINPRVPTLEEVLRLTSGKIKLDIEVKERGFEPEVLDTVLRYFKYRNFFISSFFSSVIKKVKRLDHEVMTGLIVGARPSDQFKILKLMALRMAAKADFLVINCKLWQPKLSRFFPHHKQLIYVWTVNDEKEMKVLLNHPQIAGIITDNPELGVRLRGR